MTMDPRPASLAAIGVQTCRLIWDEFCQVGCAGRRSCAVGSRLGRGVLGVARAKAQVVDGVVRLIFEGWLPHDPLFVAARNLKAGATGKGRLKAGATGKGRLPIVGSRAFARRSWAFLLLVRAPAASSGSYVARPFS
jgi:hypothetical protein